MGISTVSGPFRSKNGFQELVNGEWVPVAGGGGGGGGGFVPVHLYTQDGSFYGAVDNRYSDNAFADPPTGPTAGTIIQLPQIALGGTYYIDMPTGGGAYTAWALQLPSIPGTDLSFFASPGFIVSTGISTGSYPVYDIAAPQIGFSQSPAPSDIIYIYGSIQQSSWLGFTFSNIVTVDGFGSVALFSQSAIPIMSNYVPFPDPAIYPYTQLIGS